MIESFLEKIGFSQKEIKVYLASLQIGSQPASIIAHKAGLNRSTTYVVLGSLLKKGLVSQFIKADVRYFSAVNPDRLINYIDRLTLDLKGQKEELNALMPQFLAMVTPGVSMPRVRFFEGLEGIKSVYEDTLEGEGPIYAFESVETMPLALKDYIFNNYVKRRVALKIYAYVIATRSKDGEIFQQEDKKSMRETILIDAENYPFDIEMNIYADKIAFMSYRERGEHIGVIIKDGAIANTMKSIFKLNWDLIKKTQQRI